MLQNKDGRFTPVMFARVQLLASAEYSAVYRKVKLGRIVDGLRVVREN